MDCSIMQSISRPTRREICRTRREKAKKRHNVGKHPRWRGVHYDSLHGIKPEIVAPNACFRSDAIRLLGQTIIGLKS